jgi:hypothetical protein
MVKKVPSLSEVGGTKGLKPLVNEVEKPLGCGRVKCQVRTACDVEPTGGVEIVARRFLIDITPPRRLADRLPRTRADS